MFVYKFIKTAHAKVSTHDENPHPYKNCKCPWWNFCVNEFFCFYMTARTQNWWCDWIRMSNDYQEARIMKVDSFLCVSLNVTCSLCFSIITFVMTNEDKFYQNYKKILSARRVCENRFNHFLRKPWDEKIAAWKWSKNHQLCN